MSDLVTFLRARLDEDEQAARPASVHSASWPQGGTWHLDGVEHNVVGEEEAFCHPHNVAHIARHDPARVLRDVDAKRRIVDLHRVVGGWQDEDMNDHGLGCEECGLSEEYSDRGGWCETLRLLALPYTDHPDYCEEWRS